MKKNKKLFVTLFALTLSSLSYANSEQDAARYFEIAKHNPQQLNIFLYGMPKGGELHDHLSGAGMAENMIRYAKGDQLCINRQTLAVLPNPSCQTEDLLDNAEKFPTLYNAIIDAWSMRNFHPGKESMHDHCFAAFGKFWPIPATRSGNILAEVAQRAGEQNEQYLELMVTPDGLATGELGKKVGWDPDLRQLRVKLLNAGLNDIGKTISQKLIVDETIAASALACGTPQAKVGCTVKVRYLYQTHREQPPVQVFAQLLQGFELASHDKRVVSINMVGAENGKIALRDYSLHMRMVEFLHYVYPEVPIALHAGESGPTIAPPEALRFHIREAVQVAHATRIGHGLDITYEDHMHELLTEMAQKRVLVELTPSTEEILGFAPGEYPFSLYMSYKVPIAISTDDEGVFRTNLTEQFQKIVSVYDISYLTLKELVRNSINYSFLPADEKAHELSELERRFAYFEKQFSTRQSSIANSLP